MLNTVGLVNLDAVPVTDPAKLPVNVPTNCVELSTLPTVLA